MLDTYHLVVNRHNTGDRWPNPNAQKRVLLEGAAGLSSMLGILSGDLVPAQSTPKLNKLSKCDLNCILRINMG